MKNLILPMLAVFFLASCSSIRVANDYDTQVDFGQYKTFGFFKEGIDQADVSDLDKRRIMKAIESEMLAKGFSLSESPDLLVNIITKKSQRIDVYNNNWGYGPAWGWGGYWGPGWGNTVSRSDQGVIYVDLIDSDEKKLIWQGKGTASMNSSSPERKTEKINAMIQKILEQFPPDTGNM